jgi:hypothetical protein
MCTIFYAYNIKIEEKNNDMNEIGLKNQRQTKTKKQLSTMGSTLKWALHKPFTHLKTLN